MDGFFDNMIVGEFNGNKNYKTWNIRKRYSAYYKAWHSKRLPGVGLRWVSLQTPFTCIGGGVIKIMRDMLVIVVLFIAMSKIGNTQELKFDDGGVKLKNGCYSLILLLKQKDGSIIIRTVQDCRGGRPIWKIFGSIRL